MCRFSISRGLVYLTFALNYYYSGTDPIYYRVVNTCLHILLTLVLILTLNLLLKSPNHLRPHWIAFGVAAMWALHPIHVQTVTYVVQRLTVMMALFSLLAFYLYILWLQKRKKLYVILAAIALTCGFMSKENPIVMPSLALIYYWLVHKGEGSWFMKRRYYYQAVPIALASLTIVLVFHGYLFDHLSGAAERNSLPFESRILTQFRVFWAYISLLLFPHPAHLTLEHDVVLSQGLFSPMTTIISLLAFVVMAVCVLRLGKRLHLVSFGLIWFIVANLAEMTTPLELMFEHRTFLPSLGLAIALAAAIASLRVKRG